jgi:hypothetical protein
MDTGLHMQNFRIRIFNVIEDFYILFVSVHVCLKQTETYQRVLHKI